MLLILQYRFCENIEKQIIQFKNVDKKLPQFFERKIFIFFY